MADVWCFKCKVWMRVQEIGCEVDCDPSHIRRGDLYKCDVCGAQLVTGFGGLLNREEYYTTQEKLIKHHTFSPLPTTLETGVYTITRRDGQ